MQEQELQQQRFLREQQQHLGDSLLEEEQETQQEQQAADVSTDMEHQQTLQEELSNAIALADRLRSEVAALPYEPQLSPSQSQESLFSALRRREDQIRKLRKSLRNLEGQDQRHLEPDAPRPPPLTVPNPPELATASRPSRHVKDPLSTQESIVGKLLRRPFKPGKLNVISEQNNTLAIVRPEAQQEVSFAGGLRRARRLRSNLDVQVWGWGHEDFQGARTELLVPDVPLQLP